MPRLALLLLAAVSLATAPTVARAQDEPVPSQALDTDPRTPKPRASVALDAVALFRKTAGIEVDVALGRWQSIVLVPAVWRDGPGTGVGLEVGYRLRPFGRGLDGPFIQGSAGVIAWRTQSRERCLRVGGEVGYTALFARTSIGATAGVERRFFLDAGDRRFHPSVRLLVGYAFG